MLCFPRARVIKESIVSAFNIALLSCAYCLETPLYLTLSVTKRRTSTISIQRGRNEAIHEFPLISVPRVLSSRWFSSISDHLAEGRSRPATHSYFSLEGSPNDSSPFLDMPFENRDSEINDGNVEVDRTHVR